MNAVTYDRLSHVIGVLGVVVIIVIIVTAPAVLSARLLSAVIVSAPVSKTATPNQDVL